MPGHPLQHKEVEPDRRRHLRGFDHHNEEDAKPDHIDPGLTDHGFHDGHGQHDRGQAIHEHTKDQVEHCQHRNQRNGRQVVALDQSRKGTRQPRKSHGERQKRSPHQDESNHRRGARRPQQAIDKGCPTEAALHQGQAQCPQHTDGCRLSRGGKPHIHRPDDHNDQTKERQQKAALGDHFAQRQARLFFWALTGAKEMPAHNIEHEQPGQNEARKDPGHEQLGDAFIDGDAVDDQRQRWRDHQAQCGRTGQCADNHILRIAARTQFRDRHFTHHIERRGRGTRHRRKDRAARDVGVQKPARQKPHPRRKPAKHVLR